MTAALLRPCTCGSPWRSADLHHGQCPAQKRRQVATYWRRSTGFAGFFVEATVWLSVVTAVLHVLALVLGWTADLLAGAA